MEVVVPRTRTVAIIGCGMSGVACAARFRQRFGSGIDLTVFESAPSWGGTWHYNRYPGVACDSPNEVYSYSFHPKPNWKHKFPAGAEVVEYYTEIIDSYGLRSAIRCNTLITSCHFDARSKQWVLKVANKAAQPADGSAPAEVEEQFDFLIVAAGAQGNLIEPAELKDFKGERCHTARWDPNLDLIGKTVAVVGVGSSAAQVIPAIQPYAKHVHVFQRTPEWVLPRTENNDVPHWMIVLFTWFPILCSLWKAFVVWQYDIITYRAFGKGSFLQRTFEAAARRGIVKHFGTPVPAAVPAGVESKSLPDAAAAAADKVAAMTPQYPFGCKRIVISGTYYKALAKPNVTVHHGPLVGTEGANGTTIVSSSTPARGDKKLAEKPRIERTEIDVLISATGFDYQQWMRPLRVYGRSKVEDLGDAWMRDAGSYFGVANAGYPNSFSLLGPSTRPGHTGLCGMVETQVDHIADAIAHVLASNASTIEVCPEAQRRANQYVLDSMDEVVYGVGCAGWYQNKAGKVTMAWPKTVWNYQQQLRKLKLADWTVA